MKRINVNIYPKDGYWFQDTDGARIKADNWSAVMRKVEAYRKRAGLPPGNVEQEVSTQACKRQPASCAELSEVTAHQTLVVSLKGRVLKYLSFLRGLVEGNRIPWVGPQDAHNRANVCAQCPQNVSLPEGCASCRKAVSAMAVEVMGRGRKQDTRLGGCAVLGEYLPVSCHVDHDVVDSAALPNHCWRKQRPPG